MNGGMYRKPNICPHCRAVQDPLRDARNRLLSPEALYQAQKNLHARSIAKTQPKPALEEGSIAPEVKAPPAKLDAYVAPITFPQSKTFAPLPTDEYEAVTNEMIGYGALTDKIMEKGLHQVIIDIAPPLTEQPPQTEPNIAFVRTTHLEISVIEKDTNTEKTKSKTTQKYEDLALLTLWASGKEEENKILEESLDIELRINAPAEMEANHKHLASLPATSSQSAVTERQQKPSPNKNQFVIATSINKAQAKHHKPHDQYESILLTTETSQNVSIEKRLDLVIAECVFETSLVKSDISLQKQKNHGASSLNVLQDARRTVLDTIKKQAHLLGANTVVGLDLKYSEITRGEESLMLLVATGTAVLTKAA